MRYRGQSYEVTIPAKSIASRVDIDALAGVFHDAHKRRYGHMAENEVIEIVNFKVVAIGPIPKPELVPRRRERPPAQAAGASHGLVRVRWRALDARMAARRSRRGASFVGPAIVEEKTSTIVIYPGQTARIDGYLNIEIDLARGLTPRSATSRNSSAQQR